LIATLVSVGAVICAGAIWVTLPTGGVALEASGAPFDAHGAVAHGSVRLPSSTVAAASIVVDVEGAVARPGLHEVGADSRVGDAIAAAGGYAPDVDIEAASRILNLAAKLTDGQQVRVPALGDPATVSTPGSGPNAPTQPGGGLIDINHATADELDTLPGIGPVTAAKIIDARTAAPFAAIDELQSRGVIGPSTFEKLRDLVTVTP
jgi:competence protein ComEA